MAFIDYVHLVLAFHVRFLSSSGYVLTIGVNTSFRYTVTIAELILIFQSLLIDLKKIFWSTLPYI